MLSPHPASIAAAVIFHNGRVLICQRRPNQDFPLEWEFPGGKTEPGEEGAAALRRELAEELGIEAEIGPELARFPYRYPGRSKILLVFFAVTEFKGEVVNRVFEQIRWVPANTLTAYDFLEADVHILGKIRNVSRQAAKTAKKNS